MECKVCRRMYRADLLNACPRCLSTASDQTGTQSAPQITIMPTNSIPSQNEVSLQTMKAGIFFITVDEVKTSGSTEMLGAVSGIGYVWVWLTSYKSIRRAEYKAKLELQNNAKAIGANGVVGLKTSIASFPGFLFFRGCVVHVSATAVKRII